MWSARARRIAAGGAGWLIVALVALIAADLLLDWKLELGGGYRAALLAANLAALGALAGLRVARPIRRFDALDEALRLERARPEFNGLAVSGVQFRDESGHGPGVSRELMRAVRLRAADALARVDPRAAARATPVRVALCAAAAALAAFVALGAWRGAHLRVLAARMLNPFSRQAYPCDTAVTALDGDCEVRAGDPVTLRARAQGVIPAGGRLLVRPQGLDWETAELKPQPGPPDGLFAYAFPHVNEDFEYFFRLGDGRSARHRVRATPPPRLIEGRIGLRYPAHTGLAASEADALNLKAPEGTQVKWRLTFDRPVEGATLMMEGLEPIEMALSDGNRRAAVERTVEASRPYSLGIRWRLGGRNLVERGPQYYIQVIPDADPTVGLILPAEDAKATLEKTVALSFRARDDYGLADAAIVYAVNDGGDLVHPLPGFAGAAQAEREVVWPLTRLLTGLRVGDIVTFAVEVTDNRPGVAGRNRSVSRRVQFVSEADYLAYMAARQRKTLGQLRPLYLEQKEAARSWEGRGDGRAP